MSETVELRLYSPLQIDIINRDAPGRAIPFQAVSYHCRSEYTRIMLIDQARAVNANVKMSIFAETKCNFSPVSTQVYTALIHHITCRLEARQALIYQLVLGLTGENGKYNYSRAVHLYPPFFDISCSAKNYKIAPALTPISPNCAPNTWSQMIWRTVWKGMCRQTWQERLRDFQRKIWNCCGRQS